MLTFVHIYFKNVCSQLLDVFRIRIHCGLLKHIVSSSVVHTTADWNR